MIEFVPYEPGHLAQIDLQPVQVRWRDQFMGQKYAQSLAVPGMSWTAIKDGAVLGCAGFAPQWEGRVIAWAVFGGSIPKRAWPRIVNKVETEIQNCLVSHGRHRVEITVPHGFGAGCRLAHMLGFKVEGLMKAFGPDGSDHFLYARIVPCA